MQLGADELLDYVANIAELAERYGLVLDLVMDGTLKIEVEPDGTHGFNIVGFLPDGRQPPLAVLHVAEKWRPEPNDRYERSAYRYELIDRERGVRRAFHRHDDRVFQRRFGVVVHEHCESPIGHAPCSHIFGAPVRDGYRGLELLVAAWIADTPDCAALPCLEPI